MNGCGCTARTIGILSALTLLLSTTLLRAQTQTLFEIRYEPASVSELENAGSAQASIVVDLVNSAPIATNDDYLVNRALGQELCTFTEPAPGVLANDNDPDGDSLRAVASGPLPTGLTLNPDGSFEHFGSCYDEVTFDYFATDGFFTSDVVTVDLVLNAIPRADADASPANLGYCANPDFNISFDGSNSFDLIGDPLQYDWDFGDGTSALNAGPTPTHSYSAFGRYTVALTVRDTFGAEDTDTAFADIPCVILSPVSAGFSANPSGMTRPPSVVRLRSPQIASTVDAATEALMAAMANAPRPLATTDRYRNASQAATRRLTGGGPVATLHQSSPMKTQSTSSPRGVRIFRATYTATSGTATAGADFIEIPDTEITWDRTDTFPLTFSFDVTLLDDMLAEGDETVQLTLTTKEPEVRVLTPTGTLTITDDDPLGGAGYESSDFQVDERNQSAKITVLLRGDTPPSGGSVEYAAQAGTATAGADFQAVSGTLTWPEGDNSPKTFEVPILGDDLSEGDETIELTLANSTGIELGSPTRAVLTIQDNDEQGTVQFRRNSFQAAEDSGAATILVDLTGSMSQPASVQYTVGAGSAAAGKDFTATQGTLEWELGTEGTKTFAVEIVDDNLFEEDETITLTLHNPIGISLGSPGNANLIILDNDKPVGVQIEGGDGQSGKSGTELDEPLVIRAFNAQGEPVRGTRANWEVTTGEGELLEGAETKTDGEGLTSNRLRLGAQLGEVQVTVTVAETKESAVFNLVSELRLGELNLSATERPVAAVLDEICNGDNPGGMQSTCDDLAELSDEEQQQAMRAMTPDEVYGQGDMALAMMRVLEVTLRYRLTELRQNRRRSLDNLTLNLQGVQLPVEALADSFSFEQLENFDPADPTATQNRGGGASADEATEETDEEEDWLDKRLGFFLSGTLAVGDRPTVEQEIGLDLETTGLTVGVDYKFTNQVVWGGALGYMSNDGDLKGSGGSLDSTGLALSTYLLLLPADRLYFDVVASFGDIDFESERVIDFPGNRQVARADPQGNQTLFALGGGYDLGKGASSLTLFARGSFLDIDIDPYTEQSAPGMQLAIAGQNLESLLGTAGLEYFYNGSMNWGVLTPGVRLAYHHEFKNDLRFITARFADDPQGLSFSIATAEPDRDFFTAGLSLTATLPRGISAFATYDNDFSRDDFSFYLITAGFRLGLR